MWTLDKFHKVGELAAALAVVVSLVFVGYEVQQNRLAQTQSATEAVVRDYTGTILLLSTNPDLACIYASGMADLESLNDLERLRLSTYLFGVFYALQEMHGLAGQGSINPSIWGGFDRAAQQSFSWPGVREWYEGVRDWFGEDFQLYVEEKMAEPSSGDSLRYSQLDCLKNENS